MASDDTPDYAVYLRKSVGRAGISRQRTVTAGYVEAAGGRVAAEFSDADSTAFRKVGAARPERADFDRMLAWLRAHPGARVAAWHADRLLRDLGDTEMLIEACAAGGHLVETPRGGSYDLSTATGRKRLRADANDASYEVDHAIERITAQKNEAAAAGEWLGGPVPFGWRKDDDGQLGICPAEAAAIRTGTAAVLDGQSLASVARAWNAAGLRRHRGGSEWNQVEAGRVLLRARNAGLHVHQGRLTGVKAKWPAIVSDDDWRACRALLTDPARRTSTGPERKWLGSGLFLCGVCGATMRVTVTSPSPGGGPTRKVYRCRRARHVARDAVSLDEYVGQAVVAWLEAEDPAALIPVPDDRQLRTRLAAVRAEQVDLAREQRAGRLTVRQVAEMSAGLLECEAAIEAALAKAAMPSPLAPFAESGAASAWDRITLAQRRAVVAALMTVTVLPVPKGRPKGRRPGESYFQPGYIMITPVGRTPPP